MARCRLGFEVIDIMFNSLKKDQKNLDRELFTRCFKNPLALPVIRPTDIKIFLFSEYAWWCQSHNIPQDRQELTRIIDVGGDPVELPSHAGYVLNTGESAEQEYDEQHNTVEWIPKSTNPRDIFAEGMLMLQNGKSRAIRELPLYYYPEGLVGRADKVMKDKTAENPNALTVSEIKARKKPEERHILQACSYAFMLHNITCIEPCTFYLHPLPSKIGDSDILEYKYADWLPKLKETLVKMRNIAGQSISPRAIYRNGQELQHSYGIRENNEAKLKKDVSTVHGIGPKKAAELHACGIHTVKDYANCSEQAKAQTLGKASIKGMLEKPYAYLDIETFMDDKRVFMIGILLHETKEYVCLHDVDLDILIKKYNEWAKTSTGIIYHWGHFDRTTLQNTTADTSLFVDMLKAFKKVCTAPVKSYSIKEVAVKCGGFTWPNNDIDGIMAGSIYKAYLDGNDYNMLDELIKYNRADCEAMYSVFMWLEKKNN